MSALPVSLFRRLGLPAALGLALAGCATPVAAPPGALQPDEVVVSPSKSQNDRIRFLVMHYTVSNFLVSLKVLSEAVEGREVSSHYLVPEENDASYGDKPLKAYALVPEAKRAWHAGPSRWEDRVNLNDTSIGIENVNQAHCAGPESPKSDDGEPANLCFFPDFTPGQVQLLVKLSKDILARNPDITPTRVVGHADIAPQYKNDPGPRFPWQYLYKQGIGAWYDDATVVKYWRQFRSQKADTATLQRALKAYGYGITVTGQYDEQTRQHLLAFQAHFHQENVDGKVNDATTAKAVALVEKYFPKKLGWVLTGKEG